MLCTHLNDMAGGAGGNHLRATLSESDAMQWVSRVIHWIFVVVFLFFFHNSTSDWKKEERRSEEICLCAHGNSTMSDSLEIIATKEWPGEFMVILGSEEFVIGVLKGI